MASQALVSILAERADIHKSCKSIETLLNILNEYCEAASAVVSLQKKLAKALREAAGLKVTTDIAANAMNASAHIFDALSDVDLKFSKIADKEYDAVSTEVKKWFKKLAKEEKAHDERIANANAKIKQAGQAYEKKSKKKAIDAGEEHARYMNLISTLGPEVSQEKYNHNLNVSQRHTKTTYSVAACLSRLADTEWQRSCECVRRFSPTIGPLGQWRSLCEGGWTGRVPLDLPDQDRLNPQAHPNLATDRLAAEREPAGLTRIDEETRQPAESQGVLTPATQPELQEIVPPSAHSTPLPSASEGSNNMSSVGVSGRTSPSLNRQQPPVTTATTSPEATLAGPPPQGLEPPVSSYVDQNTGSVRSLSAFPTPPTHFPLPPPRQPRSQQTSYFQQIPSSSNLELPLNHQQLPDSPMSSNGDLSGLSDAEEPMSRPTIQNLRDIPTSPTTSTQPSPEAKFKTPKAVEDQLTREQIDTSQSDAQRPTPLRSQTALTVDTNIDLGRRQEFRQAPPSTIDTSPHVISKSDGRDGYEQVSGESGVLHRDVEVPTRPEETPKPHPALERTDTGASGGSIVAAMRNRYSNNSGSTSPTPRDVPRLPLSVNDLASRYQPTDALSSPRVRAGSPPVVRQQSLPLLDTAARRTQESYVNRAPVLLGPGAEGDRREQQRNEGSDLVEAGYKERELRERERELEMRARELEKERARLQSLRENKKGEDQANRDAGDYETSQLASRPRERRISLRQQSRHPPSRNDFASSLTEDSRLGQSRYHQTYLGPPSSSGTQAFASATQSRSPKLAERSQLPPRLESPYDSPDRDKHTNDSYSSKLNSTTSNSDTDHAPYCGCETCSVSKYKSSGGVSPVQRYTQQPSPEKAPPQRSEKSSKLGVGWMRRLSMPVGNAFSSDSKRHQSNNSTSSTNSQYALGSGVGYAPTGGGRGFFSLDAKKNASTTALSSPAYSNDRGLTVQEDGRYRQGAGRRSLETSGNSNRSMTNLGVSGR